ncbi:DUF397 domain-containing protein [Amycolatopsis sp. NEAU-NG30]|uniref:DUF397 domain-containing protein n=1 Tax=Amycolatopsis melonis TaxID=3156488 RepID=A0ABV0LGX2_9PSEU
MDDKAHIRHALDVSKAEWIRAEPKGVQLDDCLEYAFLEHSEGRNSTTYVVMRLSSAPDGLVLVFTLSEWDAFGKGVIDGEFDVPEHVPSAC